MQARRKGQQLIFEDKVLIYSIMKQDNANNNQVMQNYQISREKLLNICKELNLMLGFGTRIKQGLTDKFNNQV